MIDPIRIEVAPGELIDKITILEIKAERIGDADKLANVLAERETLTGALTAAVKPNREIDRLRADLKAVNEALWRIEDDIRECERGGDFAERFVKLARAVYRTNDRRSDLKRRINRHLGSRLVEEKSYPPY